MLIMKTMNHISREARDNLDEKDERVVSVDAVVGDAFSIKRRAYGVPLVNIQLLLAQQFRGNNGNRRSLESSMEWRDDTPVTTLATRKDLNGLSQAKLIDTIERLETEVPSLPEIINLQKVGDVERMPVKDGGEAVVVIPGADALRQLSQEAKSIITVLGQSPGPFRIGKIPHVTLGYYKKEADEYIRQEILKEVRKYLLASAAIRFGGVKYKWNDLDLRLDEKS